MNVTVLLSDSVRNNDIQALVLPGARLQLNLYASSPGFYGWRERASGVHSSRTGVVVL